MGLESGRMTESLYEFVLEQLEASKGRWSDVAVGSGLSKRTIEKIARKEIENPGIKHVEALANYFRNGSASHAAAR